MSIITYPIPLYDDAGTPLSGATVTVASVTDKAGNPVASSGAAVNLAGPNASVDYDPAAHGEAWITLAVSKAGATVTKGNAAPVVFASVNSSTLASVPPAIAALPSAAANGAAVWGASTRTVTGGSVAASNLPTDYQQRGQAVTLPASVLGAADHTAIQADVTGGLTAQGFTSARAAFLDTLNGLVASIWASTSRTLSAFGFTVAPTASQVASAILATPANLLVTNASGQVQHDLTQAVPTSGAANSVADCLNAARVQAFGKWAQSGTSLVLYNSDNTVAHTFTLDSATAPTQRA